MRFLQAKIRLKRLKKTWRFVKQLLKNKAQEYIMRTLLTNFITLRFKRGQICFHPKTYYVALFSRAYRKVNYRQIALGVEDAEPILLHL